MEVPHDRSIRAFAMIVDINGFAGMVAESNGTDVAGFVRDVLQGGVTAVEACDGAVLGFMGDAFLAILPNADATFRACVGLAKDLDQQCEYISTGQENRPELWPFAPGGAGLKIGIEYGWIDIDSIWSKALGEQRLLIGPCVNHASRILNASLEGNRCLFGPAAHGNGLGEYAHGGPFTTPGKVHEDSYKYFQLDLGDIWVEGGREVGQDTYWG